MWVKRQREQYRKNKKAMMAGDDDAAAYMDSDRVKKLEAIGFCFTITSTTSDCDTAYDINGVPDLVEGFIHLEQSDQALKESNELLRNAQTLLVTVEEVRKQRRATIRENFRSPSAVADNTAIRRRSCPMDGLSTFDLLNVFSYLELPEVVTATQTCHKLDDLLSRALLRPELLPCICEPQWALLFDVAAELLENANNGTEPLILEHAPPRFRGILQCEKCKREIVHRPPQPDGTPQTYAHVCSPGLNRGRIENIILADCVSKSVTLSYNERSLLIENTIVSWSLLPGFLRCSRVLHTSKQMLPRQDTASIIC